MPFNYSEIHKNVQLADTIKSIAKNNIKDFYQGYIAEDIVTSLNEIGGKHSIEDFQNQKTDFSNTISNNYKEKLIHQCPPNGPGITVLIMMSILEKFDFTNIRPMSAERFHLQAEATKLAYEIKEKFLGDPKFENLKI